MTQQQKGPVETQFEKADLDRASVMARARENAALTIPSALPIDSNDIGYNSQDRERLQPYQNIGSDGILNMVNRNVVTLFPYGIPWFRATPSKPLRQIKEVTEEHYNKFEEYLYIRELSIMSKIESMQYRAPMRTLLEHYYVVGNYLAKITPEYRIQPYRLDNWVQKRDGAQTLIWFITRERKDISTLSEAVKQKAGLAEEPDSDANPYDEKPYYLYTKVKRQGDNSWLIVQELNGAEINRSTETVLPYIIGGYEEVPGEDYARSFVEMKIGDLRSLNGMMKSTLDGLAAMARLLIAADSSKGVDPEDLTLPNGSIIDARVTAGIIDGVGFLTTQKHMDMNVALEGIRMIQERLGRSMLFELQMQPTGDRVTATQIMRIAQETQGAIGGDYAKLAVDMQFAVVNRVEHQMVANRELLPIPDEIKKYAEVKIITGAEALSRTTDLEKLMGALQVLAQIPGAMEELKMDVVVDRVLQNSMVDTHGIKKTPEEKQAEREQMMEQLAQQQGIESAGAIAEKNLTQ